MTHVMNITDVEDRICRVISKERCESDEYTAKYIDACGKTLMRWAARVPT